METHILQKNPEENMRKEATLEQWRELYNITIKIKAQEPWKYLWDTDLVVLELPDEKEPIYISVMGRGGSCYGIGTYVGYDGFNDFVSIMNSDLTGLPVEYIMFEQSNLSCYLGNREDVPNPSKKVIKELELKFRGQNQWIYFESYKKGYTPYILDLEEVLLLTKCYERLYIVLQEYIEQERKDEFEPGEGLFHHYDKKKGLWSTHLAPITVPERRYPGIQLKDDILISKMKKQDKIGVHLELDMVYMSVSVADKEYDRPANPKMIILLDQKQGAVIGNQMLPPGSDEVNPLIRILVDFIMEYGRPLTITVRNIFIESVIMDTCNQLGIKVKHTKNLKAVDGFMSEFKRYRM